MRRARTLAVEPLDDAAAHDAEAAEELHRAVDDALRGLGREHLGHRDLGLAGAPVSFAQAARATSRRAASSSVAMSASAACTSWNSASGLPNCTRVLHVRERLVERALRHADGRRADRGAEHVERPEREAQPLPHLADELRRGRAAHDEAPERVVVDAWRWARA